MEKRAEKAFEAISLKIKILGMLAFVFLVLLAVYVIWFYQVQRENTESLLIEESRVLVTEMDAFWEFISVNQRAINYDSGGSYDYKGLHCAIAGKAVAALFSVNSDYSIRFTNIDPRNEHNAPDAFEHEAIEAFTSKLSQGNGDNLEFYGFMEEDGQSTFRYVSAMRVTQHCVECHGTPQGQIDATGFPMEGWQIGDLAGAISVKVPTEVYFDNMYSSLLDNVVFFLFILMCVSTLIYVTLNRLIARPLINLGTSFTQTGGGSFTPVPKEPKIFSSKETDELFRQFNGMSTRLSALYAELESQVLDRTLQLSEANAELERQKLHVEEINSILKQENRYKSDFLAIVSHELRTPLTSILAFTELMAKSIPADNRQLGKHLAEVEANGQLLLEMVDNVLETARIQAGSERLNLELVDLNDIVGIVEAQNVSLAQKKGIRFVTCVDADVPLIVSDWEKLRRILVNLVRNAIKFTQPGGRVELSVSFEEEPGTEAGQESGKDAGQGAGQVLLRVLDNGIGIPEDKQEVVFERFTQENMSTVRRYGGSGLGLSLVRDLSRMLGGTVSVKSKPGEGSAFTVALPSDLTIRNSYDD